MNVFVALIACFFAVVPTVTMSLSSIYKDCEDARPSDDICRYDGSGEYAGHYSIESYKSSNIYEAYFFPSTEFTVIQIKPDNTSVSIDVSVNGYVGRNLKVGEYYPTDKDYNNTQPEIRETFLELPDWQRKLLQTKLKRLELYNSTIDGLWGRHTFNAIIGYNAVFEQSLYLGSRWAAEKLLIKISNHSQYNYKDGKLTVTDSSNAEKYCDYGQIENISSCSPVYVCKWATQGKQTKSWIKPVGIGKVWVTEAKRRNLSCGVNTEDNQQAAIVPSSKTCSNDPAKCGAVELCKKAVSLQNGNSAWKTDAYGKRYADAAKSVGLTCNVDSENPEKTYRVANGTGFFVSDDAYVITNQHVIDGCNEVQIHSNGEMASASLISQDRINDLALLRTKLEPESTFTLAPENPYLLQDVIAAGFPFGESVSSTIKVTKGVVSSLSGLGDNSGQIQIDAALQPGNSGGPIIDENGNVVGVAVAKLDLEKSIESFGVVPENVNFGIKLSNLKTFLDDNKISYTVGKEQKVKNSALGKLATEATVLLSCWMTEARIETMQNQKAMFQEVLK